MNRNVIICRSILENPAITQRELAQALDVSLGTANNLVKECISEHLIALAGAGGAYEMCIRDRYCKGKIIYLVIP